MRQRPHATPLRAYSKRKTCSAPSSGLASRIPALARCCSDVASSSPEALHSSASTRETFPGNVSEGDAARTRFTSGTRPVARRFERDRDVDGRAPRRIEQRAARPEREGVLARVRHELVEEQFERNAAPQIGTHTHTHTHSAGASPRT